MSEKDVVEVIPIEENESENDSENENMHMALSILADTFGQATEKTVKAINSKSKLDNVAIFVDYDNVYWTLVNTYNHDPDNIDPNKNLFDKLWQRYGLDNVRTFRAYADFQKIRTQLTSLQKNRIQIRHVYSNGKDGDGRKNSSDIELCVDAIENTYKDPNNTCYVFVTADSDMIPILSRMIYKGKHVELFYLKDAAPKHVDISTYAHYSEDLLDFLNVEVTNHDIKDYISDALNLIHLWDRDYGDKDRFLGQGWLRDHYTQKMGIPAKVASELIEHLKNEQLIDERPKKISSGIKQSICLTDDGTKILSSFDEVASTIKK